MAGADPEGILWRLRWPLAAVVATVGAGFAGFLALGLTPLDAFSTTLLVVTTVGSAAPDSHGAAEQAFTAVLALLGVSVYLAILAVAAGTLAEGRFGEASRRRKMQRRIDALGAHYVVCAYGRVGRTVARELEGEGAPFVVLDRDEALEEQMRADGVAYLIADPTSERALRAAGIERARGLVCAVDSDADNVFIALTGRSLNPGIFIVARASEAETAERLYRAGANRVVSPYVTSGRHMATLALRPRVIDYLEMPSGERQPVRLEEVIVEEGSPLVGRELGEVCGAATPVLVQRSQGETLRRPEAAEIVRAGDVIVVAGEPGSLRPVEGA